MTTFIARTGTNVTREDLGDRYGQFALTLGSDPAPHHEWHFASADIRDRFLRDYADGTLRKPKRPITAEELDL